MSQYSNFVELMVKQTCRRANHECETAKLKGKQTANDPTFIYSLDFLKELHDSTRENLTKLLETIKNNERNVPLNGLTYIPSGDFTMVDRRILLEFLVKIKDMSPPRSEKWIDLQHYLHFVYRNFATANPDPSAEVLSQYFVNQMRDLVKSLLAEDESQLYLRVLALLREYCIFAQWNYSKYQGEGSITRLFYYYEAMLTAAKNLSFVFSEFEILIYKNYSVCWIDFNTSVFIRFFFETEFVQKKIYNTLETRESAGDTPAMFGLLEDLKNLWIKEKRRIRRITRNAQVDENIDYFFIEEAMINSHKKVLSTNFWVERPQKDKDDLDLSRLDHHMFRLLADPMFHPAGPILDRNGQCICEECLIAKFKCALETGGEEQICDRLLKCVTHLTYCRKCLSLVDLQQFHQHINGHGESDPDNKIMHNPSRLSRVIADKINIVTLGYTNRPNLPDLVTVEPTNDKQPVDKNSENKVDPSEPQIIKTTCDIHYTKPDRKPPKHQQLDIDEASKAFEQFLINSKPGQHDELFDKGVRKYLKIKKDLFKETGKVFNNYLKQQNLQAPTTPKTHTENDRKNRELRKNAKHEKPYSGSCTKTVNGTQPSCEHGCKQEEDNKEGVCQGHGGTCDHHKESKKCDCTYCEVFGTSVNASHAHKNNELRDRLRIRLHQRREKRTKDTGKSTPASPNPSPSPNPNNSVKVKTVINKVEERVPLPSSPTNIPPAPVVKSSESSLTSSGTDDIHGLVSYIEGNSGLNKMELAEKKAAKKARQRQKKEEERLKAEEEQKRIAEELKRKEAEKKKELARKQAEQEKINKANAQSSKIDAKKSKKERQAEKRQAEKRQTEKRQAEKKQQQQLVEQKEKSNVVEETIPAMVTIKRIAEDGNSPTVTITLKGSTPDQDKLLYTLVGGPEQMTATEGKQKQNENTSTKKKKQKQKQKQAASAPPSPPAVVTKELKVTVAIDSNKSKPDSKKNKNNTKNNDGKKAASSNGNTSTNAKSKEIKKELSAEDLPIPMLRLPPGITITKVEGPVSNRNFQVTNMEDQKGPGINAGKSGVIVVDTEKLIQNKQQSMTPDAKTKSGKKNKRKKNKKQNEAQAANLNGNQNSKKMITLKNPIFQSFQTKSEPSHVDKSNDNCGPAAIFTNENGMVTIRSSRLQQSLSNGSGLNSMPLMSLSNLLPEMQKPRTNPNVFVPSQNCTEEKKDMSPFNAQEILSGLPGIEITKVDKKAVKPEMDIGKSCQTAQVSIIPASNGGEKFPLDKDDWLYDNVFNPRDILEDDLDAEELELEAFKRFCQQSIPPKRKEKVAHLNVADIVLKKKTDNYV